MPEAKEVRKHPRRQTDGMTLTAYRTQPMAAYKPRRNIGAAILDISAGGCRLRITEQVESGASLTIELRELSTGDLFHAHGTVRWIEPKETAWLAGVQFVEIFTPLAKRDKFFLGKAALHATPAREPGAGSYAQVAPRTPAQGTAAAASSAAARFKVDDYVVTAFRTGLLSSVGLRKNLATAVVDLSRTGVQVVCVEKLPTGTRVAFMLHLNKFADTFETESEVVWVKEGKEGGETVWFTGLQFGPMAPAKQKLVDYMMSWFTSYQAKYRQEHRV